MLGCVADADLKVAIATARFVLDGELLGCPFQKVGGVTKATVRRLQVCY